MIYIFIIITIIAFAAAGYFARAANRMGDGGMGLALISGALATIPVLCWCMYGLVFLAQHVRFV